MVEAVVVAVVVVVTVGMNPMVLAGLVVLATVVVFACVLAVVKPTVSTFRLHIQHANTA